LVFLDNEFEETSSDESEYEKDLDLQNLDRLKTNVQNIKSKYDKNLEKVKKG